MGSNAGPKSPGRRKFLTTTSLVAAAVAAPKVSSALVSDMPSEKESDPPAGSARQIPIGVFDPVFPNLSLEQMIEKISGWGIEAVEIGTGGYPGDKHYQEAYGAGPRQFGSIVQASSRPCSQS